MVASLVKKGHHRITRACLDGTNFILDRQSHAAERRHPARGTSKASTIPIFGITFYGPTRTAPDDRCTENGTFVYAHHRRRAAVRLPRRRRAGAATQRPGHGQLVAAYAQLHGDVPNHRSTNRASSTRAVWRHALLHDPGRHPSDSQPLVDGGCSGAGAGAARRDPAGVDRGRIRSATRVPVSTCKFQYSPDRQPDQPDRQHARRQSRLASTTRRRRIPPVIPAAGTRSRRARSVWAARPIAS